MSDPIIQLGKFKFRSTSSNVEVFFQDEMKEEGLEELEEENHSKAELEAEYQRGIDKAQSELLPQIEELQNQNTALQVDYEERIAKLTGLFQDSVNQLEGDFVGELCNMSMKLAELIIRRECVKKEQLLSLINDSFKEIFTEAEITLKLNSEDLVFISENMTSSRVTCIDEPSLKPGEAQIKYKEGFIDLSLESRIQVLKDHFDSVKTGDGLVE